jgi:hypothetical protein
MHDLLMPANYTLVDEEEMVYLDGGNDLLDSAVSFVAAIPSFVVSFAAAIPSFVVSSTVSIAESVVASARNVFFGMIYMAIDDLLNPKFQGTMVALGVLMLCSGALPEIFSKN